MKAAIVRTTIDRKTGQQINEEIIGFEEVDEDTFYRPLVEVLGKRVLEALQNNKQEGGLAESEGGGAMRSQVSDSDYMQKVVMAE